MSENESYSNQNTDEEEEDDDDDDDYDIDEGDETADEIDEGESSSVSNSSDSMNNKTDEVNQMAQLSLVTTIHSDVTGTVNPSFSSAISSTSAPPSSANISNSSIVIGKGGLNEEISPMDLTVKRHSISMDIAENKSSSIGVDNRSEDILSSVTHSSLLLRSIYETTNKVSVSTINHAFKDNPNSLGNIDEGHMFQTYLTERAVLDSAKKRYQYLPCRFEPQVAPCDEESFSKVISTEESKSVSVCPPLKSTSSLSNELTVMKPLKKTIAHEYILQESNDTSLVHKKKVSDESDQSNVSSTLPIVSTHIAHISRQNNRNNTNKVLLDSPSKPTGKFTPDISTAVEGNDTVNILPSTSSSNLITSLPSSSPVMISSDSKLLPYRRVNKNSSPSILDFDSVNAIPSPPANLTVVSNLNGNKSPTFIAPGGVMPSTSNNR